MSVYDPIAGIYDAWSREVTEDVAFYVEEAVASGGPVVELGVGTGRLAVPTAIAGIAVIGVDSSAGMLDVCRRFAERAGVGERIDLRPGDFLAPPITERVPLVTCPFRAYLHLHDDESRVVALQAAADLLLPGGRLIFDVFRPSSADIAETNGRWLEREPGIFERAEWDAERERLRLSVRGPDGETTMELAWIDTERWPELIAAAGLAVEACFGWFDRRPYGGGEDSVWVTRRQAG